MSHYVFYKFEVKHRVVATREAPLDEKHIRKAHQWAQGADGRAVRVMDKERNNAWIIVPWNKVERYL